MPVNISGVEPTLKAMRKFDGVLYKEMNKEVKVAMITIRNKARGDVPIPYPSYLYGWEKGNKTSYAPVFNTGGRVRAFPLYDASEVKRGIVYRQGKSRVNRAGFAARFYVANNSAAGAIYETAGRKSGADGQPWVGPKGGGRDVSQSNNPDAGKIFIGSMGPLYGKGKERGRLIFKAWEQDQGKAYIAVIKAIDKATTTFNTAGGAGTQSGYARGA
jgi:hypothetical protein